MQEEGGWLAGKRHGRLGPGCWLWKCRKVVRLQVYFAGRCCRICAQTVWQMRERKESRMVGLIIQTPGFLC